MREGVLSNDRFVELDRESRCIGDRSAGVHYLGRVDSRPEWHDVVSDAKGHDDLFERGVSCALAKTVYRAFDLPRSGAYSGKRIRHRHAEVVVAMSRDHDVFDSRNALSKHSDDFGAFVGSRVADGIGDVDCSRPGLDSSLHSAAKEIVLSSRAVFRRPLDVVGVLSSARDGCDDSIDHRVGIHFQLVLHMDRRSGDERVNSWSLGAFKRFGSSVDVGE